MSDTITKDQARRLAFRYAEHCLAQKDEDTYVSSCKNLLDAQNETGIEIADSIWLECVVKKHGEQ